MKYEDNPLSKREKSVLIPMGTGTPRRFVLREMSAKDEVNFLKTLQRAFTGTTGQPQGDILEEHLGNKRGLFEAVPLILPEMDTEEVSRILTRTQAQRLIEHQLKLNEYDGKQENQKQNPPDEPGEEKKTITWIDVCHDLASVYRMTPDEVWKSMSFRQLTEFYKLYIDRKSDAIKSEIERMKFEARIHGINPGDKNDRDESTSVTQTGPNTKKTIRRKTY